MLHLKSGSASPCFQQSTCVDHRAILRCHRFLCAWRTNPGALSDLMRISLQLRYPQRVSSVHAGCKDFRHSSTLRMTSPELAILTNPPEKMGMEDASETSLHVRMNWVVHSESRASFHLDSGLHKHQYRNRRSKAQPNNPRAKT